jgi:hypothetical protein
VSAVPKDFVEHKTIVLSQTAQAGLALSESLQAEKNLPVPTKDGRILYTYGVGLSVYAQSSCNLGKRSRVNPR